MKIVFVGTPDFAVPSLEQLARAGHSIELVVTRPDRRRGRGLQPAAPPVKKAALELGLPLLQPRSINSPDSIERIRNTGARLGVLVAYGEIISPDVLAALPEGFLNLHASLLPAYRGAAPINWAIINGETQTGVSVVKMVEELDAGPVLAQRAVPIGPDQTAGELHDVLAAAGAELLADVVGRLDRAEPVRQQEQNEALASVAPKLSKQDGRIDWTLPAEQIKNRVRGMTPWPGAWCYFAGRDRTELVSLLEVQAEKEAPRTPDAGPGTVIQVDSREAVRVKAGRGTVTIKAIKPASGRAMEIADFVHGRRVRVGDRFC